MNADRRRQAKQLFQAAVDLPSDQRARFVAQECGSDQALRAEVEKLLGVSETVMGGFLNTPVVEAPSSPADQDQTTPEAIGQYRIIRRLGEGGMGVVYQAEQEKTGSVVAVKVIRPGFASREILRRFEHEAQVLGRLRHPGIARVFEAGLHSAGRPAGAPAATGGSVSVPFIAMELIEGPSLLDYVESEEPDVPTVLRLFAMICDAVQHAHQHGVIHRDLKPGNILVECTDQSVQPKILDFGIARITDADTQAMTLQTNTGQLIGTVKYMSPEQAAGDPAGIDTRSDVYALGVILYELLARQMPYEVDRKLIHEALRVIREDEARPLSSISRLYRGDLTTILGKALEKEKARRYQSASDLATDIRRYLNNEPIGAHPPSAMYQLRKFARRNRGFVSGVAAVFVLLVAGIIATSWQAAAAARARDQAQAAGQAEQKQRLRAERRFKEARTLTRKFIGEFYSEISNLPGATPAKEMLVRTTLEYVNSLAEDLDPDDVSLQAELGVAYVRLGDVLGHPQRPNLGNPEGALENYLKGLRFLEAVARSPSDRVAKRANIQRDVGVLLNTIGTLLISMDRRDEAMPYFERARRILERVSEASPEDSVIRDALTYNYNVLASEHRRNGRLPEALAIYEQILSISSDLAAENPDNLVIQYNLASAHSIRAGLLHKMGRTEDALTGRQRCRDIFVALVAKRPNHAVVRNALATSHEGVGLMLQRLGRWDEALASHRESLRVGQALMDADPDYAAARWRVLEAHSGIGEVELALQRPEAALASFQESLELTRRFVESDPDDADAQRNLGANYRSIGHAHRLLGRDRQKPSDQRLNHWREAESWLAKSLAVFIDMRERGILAKDDVGVPDEIAAEIAACDAELAGFEHRAP